MEGARVAETSTQAGGAYRFDGLLAGTYTVTLDVTIPRQEVVDQQAKLTRIAFEQVPEIIRPFVVRALARC